MTKTKGQRLIQELIEKYGDAVVAFSYDRYATMLEHPDDPRHMVFPEDVTVKEIHLSDIQEVTNWDHIKKIEAIASGRRPVEKYPVLVQESKDIYDSEEQQQLHKKRSEEFQSLMGAYYHIYENPVVADPLPITSGPNTKEFGQAISNYKKRK